MDDMISNDSVEDGTGLELDPEGFPENEGSATHEEGSVNATPQPDVTSDDLVSLSQIALLDLNSSPNNHIDSEQQLSNDETAEDESIVQLNRVDSSTRPASPADHGSWGKSTAAQPLPRSNSALRTPRTSDKSDLEALRLERDNLRKVLADTQQCLAEYHGNMRKLMEEKERSEQPTNSAFADLVFERDQAIEELSNISKAFGDLHRRNEKSKGVIDGLKQNEEALKKTVDQYKALLERQEQKYLQLQKHAEAQLEKLIQETDAQKKEMATTIARYQAEMRRAEIKAESLASQLAQKTVDNEALVKICDDLLEKYGTT